MASEASERERTRHRFAGWKKAGPRTVTARLVALACLVLVVAVGCSYDEEAPAAADAGVSSEEAVDRVIDGDTVVLGSGTVVRLVQIDAPEVRGSDCYASEATATLAELLPPGTRVRVETDPALDQRDRYGRTLAYVVKDGENLNETLIERGAASVWFYRGERGRYADELVSAANDAQTAGRGLWGACDVTFDPFGAVATKHITQPVPAAASSPPSPPPAAGEGECHSSYDPCLPVAADLDCSDVRALGKAPVRVSGSDPYRLDGDGDGIGCE